MPKQFLMKHHKVVKGDGFNQIEKRIYFRKPPGNARLINKKTKYRSFNENIKLFILRDVCIYHISSESINSILEIIKGVNK